MPDTYSSLTIINIDGTEYSIPHIYRATTVRNFKRVVGMKMKCSVAAAEALQLLLLGEELEDSRTLEFYDLEDGSVIRSVPGGGGGAPTANNKLPLTKSTPVKESTRPKRTGPIIGDVFAKEGRLTYLIPDLTMDMTAEDVLDLISEKSGVDPEYLMVIYGGKQLKEGTGE
jgi:Ubiquitin family